MSDLAIRATGLSKRYRIGQGAPGHLRELIYDKVGAAARWLTGNRNGTPQSSEFWAVRDVSFEVNRGDVVGIIGRNGAGKSTLLKILSRITDPTDGRAEIYGRVGSLLEVGTGFHPELTGRENIYLNGTILGMSRAEIKKKFDEIVDFSEVEKFLDMPVKRYSSGMYVRLAFAVAAHLEPEILIVDEVLAVGDVSFQTKCLGKMGQVAQTGRTVLFVSHNMGAVQTLCNRGIVIDQGRMVIDDTSERAVREYLAQFEEKATEQLETRQERGGTGRVRVSRVEVASFDEAGTTAAATGRPARITLDLNGWLPNLRCVVKILDHMGQPLSELRSEMHGSADTTISGPQPRFVCELPELLIAPGRYRIDLALYSTEGLEDHLNAATFFDISPGQVNGRPIPKRLKSTAVCMPHRWSIVVPSSS
ncbi:MAG: ABC transporter ATP-binding protein [Phycisphaeraceae bacterium]|nr:ABC transporter ATP-binding protein [Phycisphaeraceae bacterium]